MRLGSRHPFIGQQFFGIVLLEPVAIRSYDQPACDANARCAAFYGGHSEVDRVQVQPREASKQQHQGGAKLRCLT